MNESPPEPSDAALSRRLADELPRYPAPARLRAVLSEVAPPRAARPGWLAPALAAAATALVLVLLFLPRLPRVGPPDPMEQLVRAVVDEHTRVVLWGARSREGVSAALPRLRAEVKISLERVFAGDDDLTLLGAEPVYLAERRGLAVYYRDREGRPVTYAVLPAPRLGPPAAGRVQIEKFRPALVHADGFSVWVWKQGDLACFLVADRVAERDLPRFKDYFVRVRTATEPVPAE